MERQSRNLDPASAEPRPVRRSQFWLFAPFALLAFVAVGWSAAWFVIRARTAEAFDGWLANEAVAGRRWDCLQRTIGGFPFRIEIGCAKVSLRSPDLSLDAGRLATVTQIYQPRHTILELDGPLAAAGHGLALEAGWTGLRTSLHRSRDGLQRASIAVEQPSFKATGLPLAELTGSGRRFDAHLRPAPSQASEDSAYEFAASTAAAAIPELDRLLGGTEPIDADLQLTATQVRLGALRHPREEIERWREAGGRLAINTLSLAKGTRRLEAKGELMLDEQRRPAGRIDLSAAGLGDVLSTLTGVRLPPAGAGVLGGLLQPRRREAPVGQQAADGKPALSTLPPIRLDNGRVLIGPLPVPKLRLTPLY